MVDQRSEEVAFKQVGKDAWLFKAPTPWLVGPAPHYIVDNVQKAAIANRLRRNKLISISALVISLVILGFIAARMPEIPLEFAWYCAAPILIVLIKGGRYLAIRPLVVGLSRSTDRITLSEQMRSGAAHMSLARSAIFFTLFAALAVLQTMRTFTVDATGFHVRISVEASDVVPLTILSAAFGVLAIGLAVQIIGKLRCRSSGA
jgi:ABC-type microcin C transport system permease subunit YejB